MELASVKLNVYLRAVKVTRSCSVNRGLIVQASCNQQCEMKSEVESCEETYNLRLLDEEANTGLYE